MPLSLSAVAHVSSRLILSHSSSFANRRQQFYGHCPPLQIVLNAIFGNVLVCLKMDVRLANPDAAGQRSLSKPILTSYSLSALTHDAPQSTPDQLTPTRRLASFHDSCSEWLMYDITLLNVLLSMLTRRPALLTRPNTQPTRPAQAAVRKSLAKEHPSTELESRISISACLQ